MDDAALVFVREDSAAAERLAGALERAQVSVCRSASVFETQDDYGAVVALFSPAAVRSRLVMEAAARAREEGRLVPVFVGLCPLPAAFHGIAMYDLSAWGGDANDAVVSAVAQQIRRTKQVRTTRAGLTKGMGAARPAHEEAPYQDAHSLQQEPRGLTPPPVIPARNGHPPLPALDAHAWTNPGAAPFGYNPGPNPHIAPAQISVGSNRIMDDRPQFGAGYASAPTARPDPRNGDRAYFNTQPQTYPQPTETHRRFAGLTAADDSFHHTQRPEPQTAYSTGYSAGRQQGGLDWADAWVAQELRQRGGYPPNAAAAGVGDANHHAIRAISGAGAAYPAPFSPAVAPPQGNSIDPPRTDQARSGQARRPAPSFTPADPGVRQDRLGYERPVGTQDPFGAGEAPAGTTGAGPNLKRGRNDAAFAAMLALGLATGAAGAMLMGGERIAATTPIPAATQTLYSAADGQGVPAPILPSAPSAASPEALRVQAVSLDRALGDAELAKQEPAKSNAGADRGVDRRRPTPKRR
jgi:hypothetical protein